MANSTITIGNAQITSLSDVLIERYPFTLDQLFASVPADSWRPYRERYPEVFSGPDSWRVQVSCYLIRSQGRTLLVDTGIGDASAPYAAFLGLSGHLSDRLREAAVAPEDVEAILITHLHPDHTGWNVRDEGGEVSLTFPAARYLVHQADWEAFHRPDIQAAVPFPFVEQIVTPIEALGALELVSGERAVTGEVSLIPTPGHTPGHMSVVISSGGERAVLWGDAFVHPAQVTEPDWNVAFDLDVVAAPATRRQLLERIEAGGWTVGGCHFPGAGFGRIIRFEGRRYWQSL